MLQRQNKLEIIRIYIIMANLYFIGTSSLRELVIKSSEIDLPIFKKNCSKILTGLVFLHDKTNSRVISVIAVLYESTKQEITKVEAFVVILVICGSGSGHLFQDFYLTCE